MFVRWAGGQPVEERVSYSQLDSSVRSLAGWLWGRFAVGSRALLLYPAGLEFARSYLACLYAGLIPVVAPIPQGHKHHLTPATALAFDSEASLVLTDKRTAGAVAEWMNQDGLTTGLLVATDTVVLGEDAASPAAFEIPEITQNTPMLLHYGNEASIEPTGVMISHSTLLANLTSVRDMLALDANDRFCGWLPPHHYIAQVAQLLLPLWLGAISVQMAEQDFLDQPNRWLRMIDQYSGTFAIAPNHAFERCVQEADTDLDLAGWRNAINIGERVDAGTMHRFAERFAGAGLTHSALRTAYSLREATFLVTTSPPGAPTPHQVATSTLEQGAFTASTSGTEQISFASSGVADTARIAIAHPVTGRILPPDQLGEIWVRGADVATDYWRRPAETAHTFQQNGFLRTGDLGVVHDGELYVVGRLDELVEIEGRRMHVRLIESAVQRLSPAFSGLCGSVFVHPRDRDMVVLVHEVHTNSWQLPNLRALETCVRGFLRGQLAVRGATVIFVHTSGLPRLGSGGPNRSLIRELFLAGALEPLDTAVHSAQVAV